MSNYGALQTRIGRELRKNNSTTNIQAHIQSAIRYYAKKRFWFNQGRQEVLTVAGADTVTLPTGFRKEDEVYVTISGNRFDLEKRTFDDIEQMHGLTTTTGQPWDYALRGDQIRVYPTPDAVYTLTITGIFDLGALSDDAHTNDWCTEAEDLIVSRAKYTLCRDVYFDDEGAANARLAMAEALAPLTEESGARNARRRLRAHLS